MKGRGTSKRTHGRTVALGREIVWEKENDVLSDRFNGSREGSASNLLLRNRIETTTRKQLL